MLDPPNDAQLALWEARWLSESMSDPLSTILDTIRLSSSIFSRAFMNAPYCLRSDRRPMGIFHIVAEGEGWVRCGGDWVELSVGSVALFPKGASHVLASRRGLPENNIANAPYRDDPSGVRIVEVVGAGPRTVVHCGSVEFDSSEIHPVLHNLPDMICCDATPTTVAIAAAMTAELDAGASGAATVITRLADAAIANSVRATISRSQESATWTAGLRDPRIARALAAIHAQPDHTWNAGTLAGEAGMSRSAFYERFVGLVGEPPGRYLTRWRMHVAARHLRSGSDGLADIAEQVGYASEVSFSKAFKSVTGQTPGAWRRQHAA